MQLLGWRAYKPMLQQAKGNLDRASLDLDNLKSRISSWKEELNELKNCGGICDRIRPVLHRRQLDLR